RDGRHFPPRKRGLRNGRRRELEHWRRLRNRRTIVRRRHGNVRVGRQERRRNEQGRHAGLRRQGEHERRIVVGRRQRPGHHGWRSRRERFHGRKRRLHEQQRRLQEQQRRYHGRKRRQGPRRRLRDGRFAQH